MKLVPVTIDAIQIGRPLACPLRNAHGVMLAHQGYIFRSRQELEMMVGARKELYIDADQADNFKRAYVNQLNTLVMEDRALGEIADTQYSPFDEVSTKIEVSDEPDWLDLQEQTHAILRSNHAETFLPRLQRLQSELERHTLRNPDGSLFALIHLSSTELKAYSATHAMLVCVICHLAARDVLRWPAVEVKSLCNAALTMNMGMTELQDRLAIQKDLLTPEQRRRIESHAARSVDLLQQLGVQDSLWLEAVLYHCARTPGPLAPRTDAKRLARMLQRVDMFAARLAPRATRAPDSPAAAMQSCYFDENRQFDEAGAALIKAVGIYSPGTYVRLVNGEVAVVVKRGLNSTMPKVAVLINRLGMATGEPIVRDTSQTEFRISSGMRYQDTKVRHSLDRLLQLTKYSATDRAF